MALTDIQASAAKPADQPYKLADSKGLHLYVAKTGLRSRRMKYRFSGIEKTLTCQSAFKRDPLWSHIGVQKGTTRGAAVELARRS